MCGCLLHTPSGDLAHSSGMRPDRDRTGDPSACRPTLNPLSHTSQGKNIFLKNMNELHFILVILCNPSKSGVHFMPAAHGSHFRGCVCRCGDFLQGLAGLGVAQRAREMRQEKRWPRGSLLQRSLFFRFWFKQPLRSEPLLPQPFPSPLPALCLHFLL